MHPCQRAERRPDVGAAAPVRAPRCIRPHVSTRSPSFWQFMHRWPSEVARAASATISATSCAMTAAITGSATAWNNWWPRPTAGEHQERRSFEERMQYPMASCGVMPAILGDGTGSTIRNNAASTATTLSRSKRHEEIAPDRLDGERRADRREERSDLLFAIEKRSQRLR